MISVFILLLALLGFCPGQVSSSSTCEFAFSYSGASWNYEFGNRADYDETTNKWYMTIRALPALVQFDSSGTVLNALGMSSGEFFEGVLVFAAGGRVWVFGNTASASVIVAANEDFTLASSKKYWSTSI